MERIIEKEKKYILKSVDKKTQWEKEHLVYQWYYEKSRMSSKKLKIIFDFSNHRIIYVRVTKVLKELGIAEKQVEYLDISTFRAQEMINIPFVLKRRAIRKDIYLDKFIVSNGICKYLLEVEESPITNFSDEEYIIDKEVTQNVAYYNQNMCVNFAQEDADKLNFLLETFLL